MQTAIPLWAWAVTFGLIAALFLYDYFFHVRVPHTPTLRESAVWSTAFIVIALLFGGFIWITLGARLGLEYYAGYITEKALSVDNLFVFLLIMGSFRVPRADQQKVLMFGILFAIFARGGFIYLGAALLDTFAWMFYIFGAMLLYMAGKQLKPDSEDDDAADNFLVRIARKLFHTSEHYDGDKLFTVQNGKRMMTPMLLVMVAIAATDLLFALDSIPAIFGLTDSTFIVFTATAFSLMGLRQLFFLIDGLLDRLIYLKYGLSAILAFIGVKLVMHALHENNVAFINGGEPVPVVEIGIGLSLAVIGAVLLITVVTSLRSPKGKALTVIKNAHRHAVQYLDLDFETNPMLREMNYRQLLSEEKALLQIPAKYEHLLYAEQALLDLLDQAHFVHDNYMKTNGKQHFGKDPFAGHVRLDTSRFRPTADNGHGQS